MPAQSFVDPFFYAMLLLVSTLAFVDFLLGRAGRGAVRERVAAWWVYVDDSTFAGLGAADAARMHAWFRSRLGQTASLRFIALSSLASVVASVVGTYLVLSAFDGAIIDDALDRVSGTFEMIGEGRQMQLLAGAAACVVSLAVTLRFLSAMASSSSFVKLVLLTLGDLLAVVVVVIVTARIVQSHRTWDVFDFDSLFDQFVWLGAGLAAIGPIALHVCLTALFMLSKLASPLVKQPVSLLLLRIEESEKGVLTLLGTGIGIASKLVQEGMKLL